VNGKFIFWDADACDNFSNTQEKWANILITKENVREKKTYWMRGVILEGLQKFFPK
jgi:hypothetical protein